MGRSIGTSLKAIKDIKKTKSALSLTVFETLLATATGGASYAISGIIKGALLTGASMIVNNAVNALAVASDMEEKITNFEDAFIEAFSQVLNELDASNIEEEKRNLIYNNLTHAKLHFLGGMKSN